MTRFPMAFHPVKKQDQSSRSGFVLIEVLVSMVVFSVGIMAVLTSVLSALDLQKDSTLRYRAGLILQEKLAESILVPYNGQPMRGISADGVFSWTVAGEPWTGAPQVEKKKTKVSRKTKGGKKAKSEDASSELFQMAVEVSWQTNKGTRSINATQLVHLSSHSGGTQ
ncbi:MAG: hypothetical protein DRP71_09045 [Verrucomicrobia bacterium]|nr:MAG: hypothetical protein DRP71_09045 [Verrucomicrobiota bacterium]